jgi:molybdate transport system ATP-binding protein
MIEVAAARRVGTLDLDVEFTAEARVTALFGRSGAGKSTLVNMIAGLVRPERGRIAIDQRVLFDSAAGIDVPVHERRIGYVFQEARLFPHLTVKRNLLYGHRDAGHGASLPQIAALLGLEDLLDRRPGDLSGGEKQRVAIGRALLASPRVLLMDEPLASLDHFRKGEIMQYIERLRDELGVPIVYVSHAIEEVTRLAEIMVVLTNGRRVACGPVAEIMGRLDLAPYTGRFEAGAVIEARVAGHDLDYGLTRVAFEGGECFVAGLDALAGEPVRLRIRARDVALALDRPAGTTFRNIVRGRVEEIAAGEGAIAEVRLSAGSATIVARVTRLSVADLGLHEGMTCYALIKAIALDRHTVGFA